jgi:hypothetical protein
MEKYMHKILLPILAVFIVNPAINAQDLYQHGTGRTVLKHTIIVKESPGNLVTKNGESNRSEQTAIYPKAAGDLLPKSEGLNKAALTAAGVNLTPFQPSGWGDKIIVYNSRVNTAPSNFYDASTIYDSDSVFVAFAVTNNGTETTPSGFYIKFYVDNVEKYNIYKNYLSGGYYTYWYDGNVGKLSSGSHTFEVIADANYDITETDESDNTYQRSKYIDHSSSSNVNLVLYQPTGWGDKIVLCTNRVNTSDVPTDFNGADVIYDDDSIYIAFAVANNGTSPASSGFYSRLSIDNVEIDTFYLSLLNNGYYYAWWNYNAGKLSAGNHTFRISIDVYGAVNETDETDNTYQRSKSITSTTLSSPSPAGPSNGAQITPPVTLQWQEISGATYYEAEYGAFVGPRFVSKIPATSNTQIGLDTLSAGTVYYWRVRARNSYEASRWSSLNSFTTTTTQTFSQKTIASFSSSPSLSTEYRLITIPSAGSTAVSSYISGASPDDFRLFRDNGGTPPNHLTEMGSGDAVGFGEGFWLIKKDPFILNTTLDMPGMSNGSATINIRSGWNIIGSPFTASVLWNYVKAKNNLSSAVIWSYNGGFSQAASLEPFTGYYYFSSGTSLEIPYPYSYPSSSVLDGPEVQIGIVYKSSLNKDESSFIGIDSRASADLNLFDSRKPPIFEDQGYIYFDRPEWDSKYPNFAGDVRPQLGEGQSWVFNVHHPSKELGSISFPALGKLPAGYSALLLNKETGVITKLDNTKEVEFSSINGNASFELIIGKPEYLNQKTSNLTPAQFELFQNYPNPFNPATGIRFSLPQNSFVTIKIYDILGRSITTLASEVLPAGNHQYYFDGRSYSSGIFFYVMQAFEPGTSKKIFSSSRKMILIK